MKQHFNIGFVVNNENKKAYLSAPALLVAAMRGRMTLNSVNSPGRVSTSINESLAELTATLIARKG